jgi:hypothetical protein
MPMHIKLQDHTEFYLKTP